MKLELTPQGDAKNTPLRLLVVQGDERPAVDANDEPMVMTVPHLLVREMITVLAVSTALVIISLVVDAPLEELANPEHTPNPAKAPWYFLGLQELLHYYPPLVAGVLFPGLVVVALVVVPYFDVNLERKPLWAKGRRPLVPLLAGVGALSLILMFSGAHPMWPTIIPLWVVTSAALIPLVAPNASFTKRVLAPRSLASWIFIWFLLVAITLTVIGVAFRGPGWSFTLPWRDGVFY
jgi:hypothetical protein